MKDTIKAPGFTQERLNDVQNGKLRLSDLNPTERNQIDEYSKTGKIESSEEVVTESVDTPTETVKPVDTAEKALQKKLFDTQVDANRNNQLLKQANEKVDFVNRQLEELKNNSKITARTDDNFDDATQANNVDRISRLEEMLKASLEREQNTANQQRTENDNTRQSLEKERSELAIQKLQDTYPELRTSVPITQLDGELTSFMDEIGGIDNVNKYLDDPEFKKMKDAEGVTPLSDAFIQNKEKFSKVVELNHKFSVDKDENGRSYKERNSDATIESFHMNEQLKNGVYTEQLRNAKLTGANSVIDKVVSQKHTAPTMSPSSGADLPTEGMTPNQAMDILKRVSPQIRAGKKLSVEDQASYERYQEYVKVQSIGRN